MKNKIVSWIRRQLKQADAKGVVLGLSGGIDSSVAAALVKDAVGKNRVLGLLLPCHSQERDLEDARIIAKRLRLKAELIDLSCAYDNLLKVLPKASNLAQANLKARLRMSVLYYFANKKNYLVCGTGNKSELEVGYFTKYGDGGVDILPLGGLLKKDVKALAKKLGIPKHIITKPPTAGLWPGQTDEAEMGITYKELDDILERIEKRKKQVFSREKVNKVKKMIRRSEHKRRSPRVCRV
ncbi:MAG: NAD(+) synthase [Candidatus Omnitrophica bacterium]|nr:NAD(+) synthase [Candidatus Omnitrophota bacterium]